MRVPACNNLHLSGMEQHILIQILSCPARGTNEVPALRKLHPGSVARRRATASCCESVRVLGVGNGMGWADIMDPHIMCHTFSRYKGLPLELRGPVSAVAPGFRRLDSAVRSPRYGMLSGAVLAVMAAVPRICRTSMT